MPRILVAGAGKIGTLVAIFLSQTGDYEVFLADSKIGFDSELSSVKLASLQTINLDMTQSSQVSAFVKEKSISAFISCLPFFYNIELAKIMKALHIHYFDLTEDIHVSEAIQALSKDATSALVPHCGLAPGFINIVANDMCHRFEQVESVLMCAGALPSEPHNALKYALTWSTDGLINEYSNPCMALSDKKIVCLEPLEGLESIEIDGLLYEAFNTSGGVGTLIQSYQNKINQLQYKTLRYPGHCEKIRFLFNDLNLKQDRATLKRIFEQALPSTLQDVVVVYVAVKGYRSGKLMEDTYVKKIYPKEIVGKQWSAIQIATASGVCAVVDIILHERKGIYHGMILQEAFSLQSILNNQFGQYYSEQR